MPKAQPVANTQWTVINGFMSGPNTPLNSMVAASLPQRVNGNPNKVAAWVGRLLKGKTLTGGQATEPYMGFKPGRLFDPGALRMGYATRQGKPWYSVTGPGVQVHNQLGLAEPAGYLAQQTVQVVPVTGNGGQPAGTYPQQGLSLPPPTAIGEPSSASL